MSFIRCGSGFKQILYPFLMSIFWYIRSCINYCLSIEGYTSHILLTTLLMFLGEMSGGSLYLISLLSQKKGNRNKDQFYQSVVLSKNAKQSHNQHIENLYHVQRNTIINYLLVFFAAIFDFITMNAIFIVSLEENMSNLPIQMRIIQIIFTGIIGYFMLKTGILKHQLLSCCLIIIGLILNSYTTFLSILNSIWVFITIICCNVLLSCQEVFEKYVMTYSELTVYSMLFLEGILGSLLSIIGLIIANYVPCKCSFCSNQGTVANISEMLNGINWKIGLYLFVFYLASFGLNVFALLTTYNFSPTHRSVAYSFYSMEWWFLLLLIDYKTQLNTMILDLIGFIFMIIGALIYNEIIILEFCSLDQSTKEVITTRADRDTQLAELQEPKESTNDEALII